MGVLMLRYHTTKPTKSSPTFAHYKEIAQALNLSYAVVQHIARTGCEKPQPMTIEQRVR